MLVIRGKEINNKILAISVKIQSTKLKQLRTSLNIAESTYPKPHHTRQLLIRDPSVRKKPPAAIWIEYHNKSHRAIIKSQLITPSGSDSTTSIQLKDTPINTSKT